MSDRKSKKPETSPVVSIVMPVYNAGPYIASAIESVLSQTWRDFELIIIDDFSTDESPEIIRHFKDDRIRYFRNEVNMGVAASRNRGVRISRGEFVAQMDQDDIARPYRIAVQVAFLRKRPEVGLCGGRIVKFSDGTRTLIRFPKEHEEIRVTHLFHAGFAHPTVMARRHILIENAFFYDESCRNQEDYELWCTLVEKTKTANLSQVLLDYRSHPNQLSRESSDYFTALLGRLHRRVLAPLLLNPSEEDLHLHHQISLFGDTNDIPSLIKASDWLNKLVTANELQHCYSSRVLRKVFGRKWAWLCGQAAKQGLPVFWVFWRDPLSWPVRFTMDSIKVLVKCMFRR